MTGIIPEDLFTPAQKTAFLTWLTAQPAPSDWKRWCGLYWTMWVGVKLRGKEWDLIDRSGIDNP